MVLGTSNLDIRFLFLFLTWNGAIYGYRHFSIQTAGLSSNYGASPSPTDVNEILSIDFKGSQTRPCLEEHSQGRIKSSGFHTRKENTVNLPALRDHSELLLSFSLPLFTYRVCLLPSIFSHNFHECTFAATPPNLPSNPVCKMLGAVLTSCRRLPACRWGRNVNCLLSHFLVFMLFTSVCSAYSYSQLGLNLFSCMLTSGELS